MSGIATIVTAILLASAPAPMALTKSGPSGETSNTWIGGYADIQTPPTVTVTTRPSASIGALAPATQEGSAVQHRLTLACGYRRVAEISGSDDAGACTNAMSACSFRTPPSSAPLYLLWERPTKPANQPWQYAGEYCGTDAVPPGVPKPPAVPSLGDIQRAFRALPFSKPTVSIQPVGNVTLVNLPTYFRATWPNDTTLQPGDVSSPVELLSWSVEFRVAAHSYDFSFGDGTSSGPVSDAGGTYPDGTIRHTYTRPNPHAQVKVDATLTGQFRANGGAWVDIDTVADLQNEPVTTLQVKEAQARLVTR